MTFNLVPSTPEHSDQIATICHDAYKSLTDRHNFPPMFSSVGEAKELYRKYFEIEFHYAVTAMDGGVPVGSASIWLMDKVCALGPVSVDPSYQGKSAARPMIEHLLEYAELHGHEMVRLSQRAYNPVSLSLYAKAGFNAVDSFMEMGAPPKPDKEGFVRPFKEGDIAHMDGLCNKVYGLRRSLDLAAFSALGGGSMLVRDKGNGPTAYLAFGQDFGHGVAETDDDLLALIGEAGVGSGGAAKIHCPLSNGELFRKLLDYGCRSIELHTLMAYGPYEPPNGIWLPSNEY
jgi:GNAT superfamily N-acetyltransferase